MKKVRLCNDKCDLNKQENFGEEKMSIVRTEEKSVNVDIEQRKELMDLLNNHTDCFVKNLTQLGKTDSSETKN